MASSSLDLVLPLFLLLLVCSSGVEPYPLLHYPQCHSTSSITTTQWFGSVVESQDLGAQPLPDRAVKRADHRSTLLPHRLNNSDGVLELDEPALGDGSTDGGGGGAARVDEVSEVGSAVSVSGASGPWGRPRGPMEMRAVQRIVGAPTGPVTTVMRCSSSSSSLASSSPDGSMMRDLGLMQPQLWTAHGLPLRPHGEASGSKGSIDR
jgi:hypothetical protein